VCQWIGRMSYWSRLPWCTVVIGCQALGMPITDVIGILAASTHHSYVLTALICIALVWHTKYQYLVYGVAYNISIQYINIYCSMVIKLVVSKYVRRRIKCRRNSSPYLIPYQSLYTYQHANWLLCHRACGYDTPYPMDVWMTTVCLNGFSSSILYTEIHIHSSRLQVAAVTVNRKPSLQRPTVRKEQRQKLVTYPQ
jgi:hypothetical protein